MSNEKKNIPENVSYIDVVRANQMLATNDTVYNTAQIIYLLSPVHILQFRNKIKNVYYLLVYK
jgi:hypothetical protein